MSIPTNPANPQVPNQTMPLLEDTPASEKTLRSVSKSLAVTNEEICRRLDGLRVGFQAVFSALLPGLGQIFAGYYGVGISMVIGWLIIAGAYTVWCVQTLTAPVTYSWERPEGLTGSQIAGAVILAFLWAANILHAASLERKQDPPRMSDLLNR